MKVETREPLRWETLVRADGMEIDQALARRNEECKRAADAHADRYDTRA